MNFTISRNDLLEGINIVSKAVSTKSSMPILSCILVTAYEDGIRLTANNLELGIETQMIPAQVNEAGSVALEGKMFSEIIKILSEGTVLISVEAKRKVIIKCGKSKYQIMPQEAESFPTLPSVERGNEIILLQSQLKKVIKRTIFSASIEDTRPALTGELFEIKDGVLNVVAVDGYRVAFRQLANQSEQKENKFIVPGKTLIEIQKLLSSNEVDEVALYPGENHVLFELGKCTVVSRLVEGSFLNYEGALQADAATILTMNRMELLIGIERAALITKEHQKTAIRFKVEDDRIFITSSTDIGECNEEVAVKEIEGNSGLEICFNSRYLIEALSAIEDDTINVNFGSSLQPAIIQPSEGDATYKYLVLPLRLK